jgi:gamma-glutamyltranspeptidase/glutathione hydrolase/leukotriene-C4 hydrolase
MFHLQQILKGLEGFGHKIQRVRDRGSIICAVAKVGNEIVANADFRKGGDVCGID